MSDKLLCRLGKKGNPKGFPQTVDKVRDVSLALSIYKGNQRLTPMPLKQMRQWRIIIHSCLFIEYLPRDSCQPCEAPQRGYGVDHYLRADIMSVKQERINELLDAATFDTRAFGSEADERLPFCSKSP